VKRGEINRQLKTCVMQSAELSHKWGAAKALFDAASFVNDGDESAKAREQMHTLLDMQLDNSASVMLLSRRLTESTD
jgi:hypothetical protein